ncbi:Type 1 glutamine amidotransferase-like domain-containing protein [Anaerosporobacter sp.]
MSTYILTSMFSNGFNDEIAEQFRKIIIKRNKFAFIASEFEKIHEITDKYFEFFLNMFKEKGIHFEKAYVVDGRMTKEEAKKAVAEADVIWLSGGDTPTEFNYILKYGLDKIIKDHNGVVIGMSAGSINLAETAICTVSCEHNKQEIYSGLGCVNISVKPHFDITKVSAEVLELAKKYIIYGLCDDSIIVCTDEKIEFYGEVYKIYKGCIEQCGSNTMHI